MNTNSTWKKDLIQLYTNKCFSFEEATTEIDFAVEIVTGFTSKDILMGKIPELECIEKIKNILI